MNLREIAVKARLEGIRQRREEWLAEVESRREEFEQKFRNLFKERLELEVAPKITFDVVTKTVIAEVGDIQFKINEEDEETLLFASKCTKCGNTVWKVVYSLEWLGEQLMDLEVEDCECYDCRRKGYYCPLENERVCCKQECAWWDSHHECCAVLTVSGVASKILANGIITVNCDEPKEKRRKTKRKGRSKK